MVVGIGRAGVVQRLQEARHLDEAEGQLHFESKDVAGTEEGEAGQAGVHHTRGDGSAARRTIVLIGPAQIDCPDADEGGKDRRDSCHDSADQ